MESSAPESGIVIGTSGIMATVMMTKSTACSGCGKADAGICGTGGSGMTLEVKNTPGAEKGDTVTLDLEGKTKVKGYFFVFILPVLLLFLGTIAGHTLFETSGIDGPAAATGLFGLVAGVVFALWRLKALDKSSSLYIKEIVQHASEQGQMIGSGAEELDYLRAFSRLHHTGSG